MSDNIWVSFRNPDGRTFTIGGATPNEFHDNLSGVFGDVQKADRVFDDFKVLADPPVAQAVTNAGPVRTGSGPAAAAASAPGAPTCPHGARQFKAAFTSKANKEMPSSWQCPSRDRNDQCKAQWNDA